MKRDISRNPHAHRRDPHSFERMNEYRRMSAEKRARVIDAGVKSTGEYVNRVRKLLLAGRM